MRRVLRALAVGDAAVLHRIECASTAFPWRLSQFVEGLAGGEFGWGAEIEGELRGFALFNQVLDEATLLDIAVDPRWRRRGLARLLLEYALPRLSARGAGRCLLEVREGNQPAIALYRSLGFVDDGRRRDYYPAAGGREDALLMSHPLSDPPLENR
jgi:ribosomal-protein-alanine N-acetyltransferase